MVPTLVERTRVATMRAAILTREYPPDVYGGAGVHVDFLVRELRHLVDVDVHCMGEPRPGATAHSEKDPRLTGANAALSILSADLSMTAGVSAADLVHSHTWYANFAGHLAKLLHDVPHVITAHSLEPQRPWKAEQLGGGYRVSSWVERTAYESADAVVAVSHGMAADVLAAYPAVDPARVHVIHNGIDADFYRPDPGTDVLERHRGGPGPPLRRRSSAGSPGRRGCRTCCGPGSGSTRRSSWCCSPAPRTPRS